MRWYFISGIEKIINQNAKMSLLVEPFSPIWVMKP